NESRPHETQPPCRKGESLRRKHLAHRPALPVSTARTASGISRPLLRTWGKDLTHRLQALVPELLLARLHAPVGELGVLHRHLALLGALGAEPDLDGGAVGPGDAHGLVLRRLADDDVHTGKPPCALTLLAPGAEEAAQRHIHRLAARGLVAPVA